ncbi:MAG: RluA family pseudouridine synthase [Verrucomicrobiales bacterium]|jgi:tRNA pseudouridine32 synthase/23S rRNA pseudouridine746 synthase|nr:RluA family pseudouridine synthase [Verrucomicrobiales bacterium]
MNPDLQIKILHEEAEFVVVEKPSGMLSVPGRGPEKADCVTARIRALYPDCIEQPAPHRLDMDTSGILLVTLTAEAHRNLSRQFQERETKKRYIALLDGILERDEDSGTIELPFRLDIDNRPHQIYDPEFGKMGISHWKKVGDENGQSRIEFVPVTGRTHQLRLHSAHEKGFGIPIVGDPLYGNGTGPAEMRLHACELTFSHPTTGEQTTFYSEPPF